MKILMALRVYPSATLLFPLGETVRLYGSQLYRLASLFDLDWFWRHSLAKRFGRVCATIMSAVSWALRMCRAFRARL